MPGTGAAGIMPTDARAAVRNSACPVMRTKPLINPYPAGQRRFTVALPLLDVGATEASCAVQLHPLFLLFAFMQAVQDSRAPVSARPHPQAAARDRRDTVARRRALLRWRDCDGTWQVTCAWLRLETQQDR